jgi:hypothetical protein
VALGNIGHVYQSVLAEYEKSLPYFTEALALFETLGDRDGRARPLGNIACLQQSGPPPGSYSVLHPGA